MLYQPVVEWTCLSAVKHTVCYTWALVIPFRMPLSLRLSAGRFDCIVGLDRPDARSPHWLHHLTALIDRSRRFERIELTGRPNASLASVVRLALFASAVSVASVALTAPTPSLASIVLIVAIVSIPD